MPGYFAFHTLHLRLLNYRHRQLVKKNNEKIVDDDCEKNFFFYFCSVVFYCEDVLEKKWLNNPFFSSLKAEHHIH